ncbi:hypothetical protein CEXT_456711 [Caerostris extrusa]|uniref:Uncharacterized protein n=1 Tax=Caerostris extrusa TaxID=172846 RepID=A0AAV4YAC9_CAEEX|nr:hypothetical protein CEXT_456711 [Caerostris extrusa]
MLISQSSTVLLSPLQPEASMVFVRRKPFAKESLHYTFLEYSDFGRYLPNSGDGYHVHFCRSHGGGPELPLPWSQQKGGAFLPQGTLPQEVRLLLLLQLTQEGQAHNLRGRRPPARPLSR